MTAKNTLIIGVFGEVPYAESQGDVNIPYCKIEDEPACLYRPSLNPYVSGFQKKDLTIGFSKFEEEVITEVRGVDKTIPLVSVLLTGRPVPIPDIYTTSSAVIAAWLPGTSGGHGIMSAITGDYIVRKGGVSNRKNTLSVDWLRTMVLMLLFRMASKTGLSMAPTDRSPRSQMSSSQSDSVCPPMAATPSSSSRNDCRFIAIDYSVDIDWALLYIRQQIKMYMQMNIN